MVTGIMTTSPSTITSLNFPKIRDIFMPLTRNKPTNYEKIKASSLKKEACYSLIDDNRISDTNSTTGHKGYTRASPVFLSNIWM